MTQTILNQRQEISELTVVAIPLALPSPRSSAPLTSSSSSSTATLSTPVLSELVEVDEGSPSVIVSKMDIVTTTIASVDESRPSLLDVVPSSPSSSSSSTRPSSLSSGETVPVAAHELSPPPSESTLLSSPPTPLVVPTAPKPALPRRLTLKTLSFRLPPVPTTPSLLP